MNSVPPRFFVCSVTSGLVVVRKIIILKKKFNQNHQLHSSWSVAEFIKSHFGAMPANPGCSAGRQAVGQSTEDLQMAFIDAKPWAEAEDQCTTPILTRFLLF